MATVGYAALPVLVFAASLVLFLRMMLEIGTGVQPMRRKAVDPRSGQARQRPTGASAERFKA